VFQREERVQYSVQESHYNYNKIHAKLLTSITKISLINSNVLVVVLYIRFYFMHTILNKTKQIEVFMVLLIIIKDLVSVSTNSMSLQNMAH